MASSGGTPSKFDDQLWIAADQAVLALSAELMYSFEHFRQQGGGEGEVKIQ